MTAFADLLGQTITNITGLEKGSEEIRILTAEGKRYRMLHHQGCCESVQVEDVEGDVEDIIGYPLVLAEEVTSGSDSEDNSIKALVLIGALPNVSSESFTWTFYRLATQRGFMVIRWLGESNGYYGEDVAFEEV